MKNILLVLRWIVGLLFIFSGLIKANDPLGLSYKIQEFFEVWGWDALNNYTLAIALLLNVFEIVAGVAVIIGWQMRLFSWLLLGLIIAFTFLTGYALFSGKIKTCGCFGDCIPLSSGQSFAKDIFLLVSILVLFFFRKTVSVIVPEKIAIAILAISVAGAVVLQAFVLKKLPVLDCLPYKKGNNIVQQMQMPAGAIADSFAIHFIYQKNGKQISFDQAHFPDDFDSSYVYVDRKDVLVKKGNGLKPAISDFSLQTLSGADTTAAIFENSRYLLVLAKDFDAYRVWKNSIKEILSEAAANHITVFLVTADVNTAIDSLHSVPILKCDATVLKTAARVTPTVFFMQKATIVAKYSYADQKPILALMNAWK